MFFGAAVCFWRIGYVNHVNHVNQKNHGSDNFATRALPRAVYTPSSHHPIASLSHKEIICIFAGRFYLLFVSLFKTVLRE
jgi:hypothetical protein